jgi:hypothetical protein
MRGEAASLADSSEVSRLPNGSSQPLLSIENLRVEFKTDRGTIVGVDDVTFTVNPARWSAWWASRGPANR